MSFFSADPPEDAPHDETPARPWWRPPHDELPALLPVSEVIVSTETLVIALVGAHVYSVGVEFLLDRRMRRGTMSAAEWSRVQAEFMGHWAPSPNAERLRWGMALGDGQQIVLDGRRGGLEGDAPAGHTLTPTGGGGGGDTSYYRMEDGLWLWPLPPEGPLEIVLQWPALGIPESRVILNAAPLRALATTARPLWS